MLIKPRPSVRSHNIEYLDPTGDHMIDSHNMQAAIDRLEAKGGGLLVLGVGTFHLSASPLIASGVHIMGQGRGTILKGYRPGPKGHALIYNKGYDKPGYEGASNFGISHVTIDSPDSNGITFVHGKNILVSHIYGLDAYHHFIDIGACKNVVCHDLFLTGESGTAPFQIDALPTSGSASRGWNGTTTINPLTDNTGCDTFYLDRAVITATVRDASQSWSIHFHKIRGRNIFISNVTVGNTDVGIYQDAGTYWDNIRIDNVHGYNLERGVWLRSNNEQTGLSITNSVFENLSGNAVEINRRSDITLHNLRLSGNGGTGIVLNNVNGAQIGQSVIRGFNTGMRANGSTSGHSYSGVRFVDCVTDVSGVPFEQWGTS